MPNTFPISLNKKHVSIINAMAGEERGNPNIAYPYRNWTLLRNCTFPSPKSFQLVYESLCCAIALFRLFCFPIGYLQLMARTFFQFVSLQKCIIFDKQEFLTSFANILVKWDIWKQTYMVFVSMRIEYCLVFFLIILDNISNHKSVFFRSCWLSIAWQILPKVYEYSGRICPYLGYTTSYLIKSSMYFYLHPTSNVISALCQTNKGSAIFCSLAVSFAISSCFSRAFFSSFPRYARIIIIRGVSDKFSPV